MHKGSTLLASGLFVLATVIPSMAFADCKNLNRNEDWRMMLDYMKTEIEAKNYQDAIETSKALAAICKDSPALLYMTGMAYQGIGDKAHALSFFQRASEKTTEFDMDPNSLKQIWFARFEAENPDSEREIVKQQVAEIDALKRQVYDLELDKASAALDNSPVRYKTVMWTGTGVGAVGLVSLIAGGVLLATSDKIKGVPFVETDVIINGSYTAGWTLLGLGIGMTVAGAAMAGLGGYFYSHVGSDETPSSGADISFNVGPTSAGMHIAF